MKIIDSTDQQQRKTLILHDTFLYKWGWERLILMMAEALDADIASGFFSKWSFDLREEWFKWKIIELSSEIFAKWFRHIKLKHAFLQKTTFIKEYETVIFSWDCISAVRNAGKSSRSIYYCHTPPRYLYDLRDEYIKKLAWFMKPAFYIISFVFKKMYETDITYFNEIICNSQNTATRLHHFTWRESSILYPPAQLQKFRYKETKDYYLSFARLSSAKRIDNIVKAFSKIPDKKLVVIYWVNDPQKNEVFELWKDSPNIEFVTCPWNKWFYDYIWNCIATIYIPIDEDFWMSPVESMSAWKPVIGVNEWWLKESIIHWKTGLLIPEWWSVEDIIEAVSIITKEKALLMKKACELRARDFSYESFEKQIQNIINTPYSWK